MKNFMTIILLALISFYQNLISPFFAPRCRFSPTCSQYSKESIKKYGPVKGFILTFKRIVKCHPWGGSGYDPIP
tara:strand:+ start:1349 stop:1570 length:222 start_codon:yes stop_codon:yes gene_type:complete